MDDPANTKRYDTQFLHQGVSYKPTLRAAVQEMKSTGSTTNVVKSIACIMMMQLTAKAGIKKHGQVALDALFKEFSQLHDLGVFLAQDGNKLTQDEKRGALRAISMITEKRCGRIKGRTVADRRPQKALDAKEDKASPTVATDALMLSILIDAKERRDVATADVAGAYLHADMDNFTLLKIKGTPSISCVTYARSTSFLLSTNEGRRCYI
jgi:hypothetical protein